MAVGGRFIFDGTLEGIAPGKTRAVVLASCEDVAANPPSTFRETFRAKIEFAGLMNGKQLVTDITYRGTANAGEITSGTFIFTDGLIGSLEADEAIVNVGGSYGGYLGREGWDEWDERNE